MRYAPRPAPAGCQRVSGVVYPQRPCGRVQAPAESHVREAGPVSMGDIYATIYKAVGIDWEKEYMSPAGRPVKIANALDDRTAEPLKELV